MYMSEYIHEIVLQEFIIENINSLDITVQYKKLSRMKVVAARKNMNGTFWDIEGELENGIWIPIEVEWISSNFIAHKHHTNSNFKRFRDENGVLLVLRRNKEIYDVQQISIFDNIAEAQFKKRFLSWFKGKTTEYVDETLKTYTIGAYKRDIPRIILYPLSQKAWKNYFKQDDLYKKHASDPAIIGFKPTGYDKNIFIKDLQPGDVCLFIASDGKRCKRSEFIDKIKNKELKIHKLAGYKIKQRIQDKRSTSIAIDDEYWPDEILERKIIYPYICEVEDKPFIDKADVDFPFIKRFSDNTWEAFRSCIQYGEYRELSSLDFTDFISNL